MEDRSGRADVQYLTLLRIGVAISFFLTGLYYELEAAVVSAFLLAVLLYHMRHSGLRFLWSPAAIGTAVVWVFYLLSAIWGIDPGTALYGAVKYLPMALFALCLQQTDASGRKRMLKDIPGIGAWMTAVTWVLQQIPAVSGAVTVSGRMAGFFQYPNTFACFLLTGLVVLLLGNDTEPGKKESLANAERRRTRNQEPGVKRTTAAAAVKAAILMFGLLQSGSRSVYLLAAAALAACLIIRRRSLYQYAAVAGAVAAGVLLSFLAGGLSLQPVSERVASISLNAGTLLERVLYWKDALPVILQHPLGLGYLGYFMTQGSFRTGVYSTRWVHNDFLQLLLDVGWIPAVLAAAAVFFAIFSKKNDAMRRTVLVALILHCLVDFDLEFTAMYFILLLCLDWETPVRAGNHAEGKRAAAQRAGGKDPAVGQAISWKVSHFLICAVAAAVLTAGSVYIGIVSTLTYAGMYETASSIYPWNTLSDVELLANTDDADEMEELADRILKRNQWVSAAWDAKALSAYGNGDFSSYITYKKKAISLNRYDITEYEDYFTCLKTGVELYLQAGDSESAKVCMLEIIDIQNMLDELEEETDSIAYSLADQPVFTMSDEYQEYITQAQ